MLAQQAITVLDHKCWMLVDTDGKPYSNQDDDGVTHYESKEKAEEGYDARFRRYDDEELAELPLLLPAELDAPCMTIATVCGYVLDEDEDGICHHDDAQVLVDDALGMGWSVLPDGRMVCCTDERACTDCAAAAAGLPPTPEPIPGQLTLDGRMVVAAGAEPPPLGDLSPAAQADLAELAKRDGHAS